MRRSTRRADHQLHGAGFSLIEAVVTLTVIATITVGLVSIADSALHQVQERMTADRLTRLRSAMLGTPLAAAPGAQSGFGYLGDMGSLPPDLESLWTEGTQPAFSFDTTLQTGAGWNGPYLDTEAVQFVESLTMDAWSAELFYSRTPFVEPELGVTVFGKLASLGPDRVLDTDDDIAVLVERRQVMSYVTGFVQDAGGNPLSGVMIRANFPESGALASETVETGLSGSYAFEEIPFGNRSLTPEPKLIYSPGTAETIGGQNDEVRLRIENSGTDSTAITSVTVEYSIDPPAYFRTLRIGNTNVYQSRTPRLASGDTVNFSPQAIAGTGEPVPSTAVAVQAPTTTVPPIVIGTVGLGGSLEIRMDEFRDVQSGNGGNPVDMAGVGFRLTFSDGSVAVFAPE